MEIEQRSAIPKVVGILMIVFALIGLAWTGIVMFQEQLMKEMMGADKTMSRANLAFDLVALAIGVLQLIAGLKALGYKDRAPRLAVMYALAKLASIAAWVLVTYLYLIPHLGGGRVAADSIVDGSGVIISAAFYAAWPIIVLALMTRPAVRASCTSF